MMDECKHCGGSMEIAGEFKNGRKVFRCERCGICTTNRQKGEIIIKFYRVCFMETSRWGPGINQETLKYFRNLEDARKYAKKLLPHLNEGWETESIIIENEYGIIVDQWVAEEGKIVYYLMGEVAASQKL